MDHLSHPALIEATRLTHAGRLMDATALLQRMLNGGTASDAPSTPTPAPKAHLWRAPDGIDLVPETVDPVDAKTSTRTGLFEGTATEAMSARGQAAGQPAMPEALRGFLEQLKFNPSGGLPNLDGLVNRPPARTPDIVPDGGQFLERSYANQAGSRAYKLYVPSGYHGQALPLVVMLHGCTQSPDDFAAGTRMNVLAEEHACLVAYPAQAASANHSKCWNWFKPGDQQRDQGEPSLIAGITRQIMRDYAVDPQRVYVAGLSAGGAAAAIMGATYPDLYAAVGVHSGLACGAAQRHAVRLRRHAAGRDRETRIGPARPRRWAGEPAVPTIVFHGDQDGTVHPRNGDQVIAQAESRRRSGPAGDEDGSAGQAARRTCLQPHPPCRCRADKPMLEQWVIHGAGHAWSGGSPAGSYTDPRGPDASREMLRFFLDHPRSGTVG